MMNRYRVFFVVVAWLLLMPVVVQAQEPESDTEPGAGPAITIAGQITNATPGGPVPTGVSLMLHTYDGVGGTPPAMTGMTDGTVDEQGHFRFENVPTAPGRTFEVMATYQGVTYFSQRVEPQSGQQQLSLPVAVYETTTDPSHVQVAQQHLLLDFTPGAMHITHLYILSNTGDRAVVGGGENRLEFHLPAGATDVAFERDPEGKRYVRLENGFADTAPVAPGQGTQASMVSYAVPYQDGIELSIPIDYPTAQTAVLLPETGVKLDGPEWMAGEEMLVEDQVHQVFAYSKGPLAAGDALKLIVSGKPQLAEPAASSRSEPVEQQLTVAEMPAQDNRLPLFLAGLALSLTLIGSGTVWWWRDRRPVPTAHHAESEALQAVLQAIADLDDAHAAGDIDGTEYQERRADLHERAVRLMQTQTKLES